MLKNDKPAGEEKKPTYEEAQKEIAEQSGLNDLLGIDPTKSKGIQSKTDMLKHHVKLNLLHCFFLSMHTTYLTNHLL